jgi:hypothetical protein
MRCYTPVAIALAPRIVEPWFAVVFARLRRCPYGLRAVARGAIERLASAAKPIRERPCLGRSAALDIALCRRSLVYPLGVSRRFWAAAYVSRGRLT